MSESFEEEGASRAVEVADMPTTMNVSESLRDDPFAVREGKTLTWRNVNMVLVRTNNHEYRRCSCYPCR